jgi:hypothetical protein
MEDAEKSGTGPAPQLRAKGDPVSAPTAARSTTGSGHRQVTEGPPRRTAKGISAMTEQEGEQPIGELLDGLGPSARKALAASGFDLPRLRELALTEPRQVRHIVTEFGGEVTARLARSHAWEFAGTPGRTAAFWGLTLLIAATGTALAVIATVLVDFPLGAGVGVLVLIGLLLLRSALGPSPRVQLLYTLTLVATIVLVFGAVLYAPQWYLAVRGTQATGTLESPVYVWEHGSHNAYCRVRLPDGTVHRMRGDGRCDHETGSPTPVVYDPHHRVGPVLGHREGLGATSRAVAEGAGAVVIATAVTGTALAYRRRGAGRLRTG